MCTNTCGAECATSVTTTQCPKPILASAEQYVDRVKRTANNDTVSIRETVKWLTTLTESLDLPHLHESIARQAMWHEKQVDLVLRTLDRYDARKVDRQTPILAKPLQKLREIKKEALGNIITEVANSLVITCKSSDQTADRPCHGKSVSSKSYAMQDAYAAANKDMNHLLCLLSGLITTIIIDKRRPDDASLIDSEIGMRCSVQRGLDGTKEIGIECKLSSEEQLYWIAANLKQILAYVDIWQDIIDGNREEGEPAHK